MDLFDNVVVCLVFMLSLVYLYYRPSSASSSASTDNSSSGSSGARSSSVINDKSVQGGSSSSPGFLGRMKQKNAKVIIFYGSQTGTAEDYARRLMKEASQYGLAAVLADLMDYEPDELLEVPNDHLVIFVLATYGDGEPTDNAHDFHDWIQGDHGDGSLSNLNYAVFGLGNKTYTHFNAIARKTDSRLNKFGAKLLHVRGEGDDDADMEEDFVQWSDGLWKCVCQFFSIDPSTVQSDIFRSYHFRLLAGNGPKNVYTGELGVFNSWSGHQNRVSYDQNGDVDLPRRCFHLEIDVSGTSFRYQSGDHVAIYAPNDPVEVDSLAKALGVYDSLDMIFEMRSAEAGGPISKKTPFPCPTTLRAAMTYYLDIQVVPKMHILALFSRFATDEAEKQHLRKLSSMETKEYYHKYIYNDCRNLRQVLEDHKSVKFQLIETNNNSVDTKSILTIADLFETLPRLQPRYYSISSSSKVSPNSVHVTATVVRYKTDSGRIGNGIVTSYLYNLLSTGEYRSTKIPIFMRKSHFKLPRNNLTPVIFIGPGTGLAPLRGFMIERRAVLKSKLNEYRAKQGMSTLNDGELWGAASSLMTNSEPGKLVVKRQVVEDETMPLKKMIGDTLLFFGCRNRNEDFLYCDELLGVPQDSLKTGNNTQVSTLHEGLTGLYCAFSRERKEKTYVQQLLLDNGDDVWQALHNNAYVYVCGDAKNMARDVQAAILSLAKDPKRGNMSPNEAENWVKKLKDGARYQEDVWS